MFTGIVEELNAVNSIDKKGKSHRVTIEGKKVLEQTVIGDSIAINGVCQTVVSLTGNTFTVDISETTMKKSTLGDLQKGQIVNLERAMKLSDRLGGHLVQGHVNFTTLVEDIKKSGEMYFLSFKISDCYLKYFIYEGSVTVDGISLTISEINKLSGTITIQVIPHTFENTILKYYKKGRNINIETDMVGRFIESFIKDKNSENMTKTKLIRWGY